MSVLIKKTAAQFTSSNPILTLNQIGQETDTFLVKVGDGIIAWNDLYYSTPVPNSFEQVLSNFTYRVPSSKAVKDYVTSFIGLNNYVLVKALSDFPAPVATVITLADNTTYQINGDIDLGANRIVLGTNNIIFGLNRLTDKLRVSTLTGDMITGVGKFFLLTNLTIACPNGTLFNLNGGVVSLFGIAFSTTKNFGTMNAMSVVAFRTCGSVVQIFTNQGLVLSGACTNFDLVDCLFFDNVGTVIDFGTSVWTSVIIDRNRFTANAGQTIISGAAASANIAVGGNGNIGGNNFFGAGTYLNTITQTDIRWKFFDNGGIRNTHSRGSFNMIGNATATVIAVVSTPVKILGTTIAGTLEHFTHSNNRLTYTGIDTITVLVAYACSYKTAVANRNLRFFIAKNGTILTTSTIKELSGSAADLSEITCIDNILFATGDYIEAWVQNDTNASNITADTLNFQIS